MENLPLLSARPPTKTKVVVSARIAVLLAVSSGTAVVRSLVVGIQ